MATTGVRSILLSGIMLLTLLAFGCGGGGGGGSGGYVPSGGGGEEPPEDTGSLSGRVLPSGSGLTVPESSGGQANLQIRQRQIIPGEAVVWFADGVDPEEGLSRLMDTIGGDLRIEELLTTKGPALIAGGPPDQEGTREWIEMLSSQPAVRLAEANSIQSVSDALGGSAPNDPVTNRHSWSYDLIRTSGAWNHSMGDASIVVAVVDSGVGLNGSMHPDLEGQILPGWDFVDGDNDPTDVIGGHYHGTHVAGTVAARANNGMGVAGIAPQARVLPVRVLGTSGGGSWDVASGIRWAAGLDVSGVPSNLNPARIINLSLGSPNPSTVIEDAIAAATDAGVLVIASAGNDHSSVGYPAAFSDVIAVSAVGPTAELAWYSNKGSQIELAAPGGSGDYPDNEVWSTTYSRNDASPTYEGWPGTSMACPHVSAVAALCLSVNPDLSPAQLRSVLQSTAVDLGAGGRDSDYGFGLVDAQAAVERSLELASAPPASKPEQLAARTTHLRLTSSTTSETLRYTNTGDGSTQVTTVRTFALVNGVRVADPNWLSASIDQSTATGTSDALVIVSVNPDLAGSGLRQGLVEVTGEHGVVITPVLYLTETIPDLGVVRVYALDADTDELVGSATTSLSKNYDFTIEALPAGSYYLFALVDKNGDHDLDRADEWFGFYPSLAMETVTIDQDGLRSGLGIPLFQEAEWLEDGTGGGSIIDPLCVLVYDDESGLPLEGARVILGDEQREILTDYRGVAVFTGLTGKQTVTTVVPGYNAESYVDINAAEIGIGLTRTDTGEEPVTVDITVYGLLTGESAELYLGFTYLGSMPWDDADRTITVEISKPGFLNVLALNDTTGITYAGAWAEISAQFLASNSRQLTVTVYSMDSWTEVGVDVQATDPTFDMAAIYPVMFGSRLEDAGILGLGVTISLDQRVSTRMFYDYGFEDYEASLLVLALNSVTGESSTRIVSRTMDDFYGMVWTVPVPPTPKLQSPAEGSLLSEGDFLFFSTPTGLTVGMLHLARQSDELTWNLRFPPGATQVRLPRIEFLSAGAWQWWVDSFHMDGVTYQTLSGLPSNLADGFAAIDWIAISEKWGVTVP